MWIVLLVIGIVFVLGAVPAALVAAGRARFILPVIAGLIGIICLVAAFALRPASIRSTATYSSGSGATAAAPSVAAPAGPVQTCGSGSAVLGPYEENPKGRPGSGPALPRTLPEDVQHLPFAIHGLTGQIGDVVASPGFANVDVRETTIATTIGYVMRDADSVHYDRAAGEMYSSGTLWVEVGTPRTGTCPDQLSVTALGNFGGGGHISAIHRIARTGPRLAAAHAVLTCGAVPATASSCAWAGTGPKGTPFFGFFYGFVVLSDGLLAQLADQLYGAFTG
jgi:hypothetical protein